MAEDALGALYKAVRARLSASNETWGNSGSSSRSYADLAPAGTAKPFVVYGLNAGGELNARRGQDAEIVLTIQGVAEENAGTAMDIAERLSELFNDAEDTVGALNAGSEWTIRHVVQLQRVHYIEMVDGKKVYHSGHRFRFRMEAI